MKSGIYRIINVVNGKLYVGSSTNVAYRLWWHRRELSFNRHENRYLQNAWNKHGESSFKFELLFNCEREQLLQKEQETIDRYKSTWKDSGYNICFNTRNCLGVKRSPETREKMKGNTNAKGRKGCHHSQESKELMSIAKLGKPSNSKGHKCSEEAKHLMTIAKLGKPSNNKGKPNPYKGLHYKKKEVLI